MKNNKGFTLVELIASFTLALIIMFFLFQIVIAVKELYVSSGMKTELLIKQANLEKQLVTDLKEKDLTKISSCGEDCYTFSYNNSASKTLQVDRNHNTIQYGDYKVTLMEGSSIGEYTIQNQTISDVALLKNNSIVSITIPVFNKALAGRDYGIHLIYQYDSRTKNLGL